jgi:GNAT superfamily N-acetyltransferase
MTGEGERHLKGGEVEVILRPGSAEELAEYANVPIGFLVDRVLVPESGGEPLRLQENPCAQPFLKDNDLEPGNHPTRWSERFDVSSWVIVSIWKDGRRVGGAVVIQSSDEVEMLEGRLDLALIWDIRVRPADRGNGLGVLLLGAIEEWVRSHGYAEVKVETQNINVRACRFYQRMGFELRAVNPGAYTGLPEEIQLLWYKGVA